MKKKSAAPRKSHPEGFLQLGWDKPDINKLDLRYNYGNSIVAEFVLGHDHADVLRELVQNEYDAGGRRLEGTFDTKTLLVAGKGSAIDAAAWKQLSVMLGTVQVGCSD